MKHLNILPYLKKHFFHFSALTLYTLIEVPLNSALYLDMFFEVGPLVTYFKYDKYHTPFCVIFLFLKTHEKHIIYEKFGTIFLGKRGFHYDCSFWTSNCWISRWRFNNDEFR